MNTKYIIFAIAIFLVFVGAYLLYGESTQYAQAPNGDPASGLRVGSDAIYVADQMPGNSIEVGFVVLREPGFVVIHSDEDENPGEILGESVLINAGENDNIPRVALNRETRDGETLFAMLHDDNGDRVFNAVQDSSVKDNNGEIIMMKFIIDALAEESGIINL